MRICTANSESIPISPIQAHGGVSAGPAAIHVTATESISNLSATSSCNVQVQRGPQIGGLATTTIDYRLNRPAVKIFSGAAVSDDSTSDLNGGTLTIDLNNASNGDRLGIKPYSGVQISLRRIKVNGTVIGTITQGPQHLQVALNGNATSARLETLLHAITFHAVRGTQTRLAAISLTDGVMPLTATGQVSIGVRR
jgi:hypothetical protein